MWPSQSKWTSVPFTEWNRAAPFQVILHGRPKGGGSGQTPSRPCTFNSSRNTHTLGTFKTINLSCQHPTELTAVILEPTHSNPFLICYTSGYWLLVLSPISSSVSLTDACVLPVTGTGLVLFTSSHVFYVQCNIPQTACEHNTSSFTGVFMGWGQGFTKVRPFILLCAWPISEIQDGVVHTDPDLISNCPIKPRQLAHNELFLNEFV